MPADDLSIVHNVCFDFRTENKLSSPNKGCFSIWDFPYQYLWIRMSVLAKIYKAFQASNWQCFSCLSVTEQHVNLEVAMAYDNLEWEIIIDYGNSSVISSNKSGYWPIGAHRPTAVWGYRPQFARRFPSERDDILFKFCSQILFLKKKLQRDFKVKEMTFN